METQRSDVRPQRSQCLTVLTPLSWCSLQPWARHQHQLRGVSQLPGCARELLPEQSPHSSAICLPSHAPSHTKTSAAVPVQKKTRSSWAWRWARVAAAAPQSSALPSRHACTPVLSLGAEFLLPTSCMALRAPPSLPHIFHSHL